MQLSNKTRIESHLKKKEKKIPLQLTFLILQISSQWLASFLSALGYSRVVDGTGPLLELVLGRCLNVWDYGVVVCLGDPGVQSR